MNAGADMPSLVAAEWYVTAEKVREAVHRLIEQVDPIAIIAFGSRARGTHRPDSDLDLAVILDSTEQNIFERVPPEIFSGLRMPVDLLPITKGTFDRFRPWLSSVHNQIDREGVKLYERGTEPASSLVIRQIC